MGGYVRFSHPWPSRCIWQKEELSEPHWSLRTLQKALPHIWLPFFINNSTSRNHFRTAVLSSTTNASMTTRWERKEDAAYLGEEDIACHGSKKICVGSLERYSVLATQQRLVHLHQPCQMIWLLQPTNNGFGDSNIWTYLLIYTNLQVKPTNNPLMRSPNYSLWTLRLKHHFPRGWFNHLIPKGARARPNVVGRHISLLIFLSNRNSYKS